MTTELVTIGGALGRPSKMPGRAFGFSPDYCVTGSRLRKVPGSVCADCYACKGRYTMPNTLRAHARRYKKLRRALTEPAYRERYIRAWSLVLGRMRRQPFFRWHDAGDIQSAGHLGIIAEIARRTPRVHHWLPTREYKMVREYLATCELPPNLNVRLSAHMIGETIPAAGILPGCTASAVSTRQGYQCPAREQGNKCRECRACWDTNVELVSYEQH